MAHVRFGRRATATPRTDVPTAHASLQEEIARRAYELYERRGRLDGHDREDWLEAERLIQQRRGIRERLHRRTS